MIIKSIELNNFRIYKGVNKINLMPDGERNIIIISGNNGFGKTTFLMSLVWCLYGKNMEKVDDLYKKEIDEKGGYGKYIGNSLNTQAEHNGETKFSVSLTFSDVEIPDIACTEITIIRSYDSATNTNDELKIFIDGKDSELFKDKQEEEMFIRDYILPIEIAKFFFFDAEKIVSFAQINTLEQRAELSKAYSQVLGIQKYDELRRELEKIQDDYRKESAKPEEKREFNNLNSNIESDENEIVDIDKEISELQENMSLKKLELDELQERLIREGDTMNIGQLNELKVKSESLQEEVVQAQDGLKDLYNYIPFGLAGNEISSLAMQLKKEKAYKKNQIQLEGVEEKTDSIIQELDNSRVDCKKIIDVTIRDFYEKKIKELILKYFYNDIDINKFNNFQMLHDFTDLQYDDFQQLVTKIKECKSSFEKLYDKYTKAENRLREIDRKIREAEKKAESDYIQSLRRKKETEDEELTAMQEKIFRLNNQREEVKERIKATKQKKEILSKKIEVSDKNKAVDEQATQLIHIIQKFLLRFKEEKKKALEKKLKLKLVSFLHKKDLIGNVVVDIQGNGEDVDINLFDSNDRKIDKSILSMGERQMFASALLGALVEETEIDFPVFIDSPMQKFDVNHSRNILTQFYPTVSKQVILFPLLMKELTEIEYSLIEQNVNKAYLIENTKEGSHFSEVTPQDLFNTYKNH